MERQHSCHALPPSFTLSVISHTSLFTSSLHPFSTPSTFFKSFLHSHLMPLIIPTSFHLRTFFLFHICFPLLSFPLNSLIIFPSFPLLLSTCPHLSFSHLSATTPLCPPHQLPSHFHSSYLLSITSPPLFSSFLHSSSTFTHLPSPTPSTLLSSPPPSQSFLHSLPILIILAPLLSLLLPTKSFSPAAPSSSPSVLIRNACEEGNNESFPPIPPPPTTFPPKPPPPPPPGHFSRQHFYLEVVFVRYEGY